jgi:hypothetical protein
MTTASLFRSAMIAVCIGASLFATQADARRFGGVHARPHIAARPHVRAHVAARNVNVARHVVHRNGRRWVNGRWVYGRWVNGVWIASAVAAGAVAASDTCAYYWNRWKVTGNAYWHQKYYDSCG